MLAKIAFSALLAVCLVSQGMAQCTIKDLKLATSATGELAKGGKPVQQVKLTNECSCGQSDVIVDCIGLQSSAPLVNLTKVDGSKCLVNNGDIIYPRESATFSYAWDTVFRFTPVDSRISCS